MPVEIPYRRDMTFEYGRMEQVAPLVRRVIAKNPSAFTFHGTGTYIIGEGKVAVIDPGPIDGAHISAIDEALGDEVVSHMLITHTHMDHSPAARLLARRRPAPTYGFGPHGAGKVAEGVQVEEGGDMEFRPDVQVGHGDVIDGDGWSVECVYTPGHTSNHLCFCLREARTLFSGDHVMGWSTSVISPPDGDMKSYMGSLQLLLERDDDVYWPTHGPAITDPKAHVQAFIEHRRERERQILDFLAEGPAHIADMVPTMYAAVPVGLHPAAARSVFAAMQFLVERGDVACEGELAVESRFRLAS